jgi:hypothetical protein
MPARQQSTTERVIAELQDDPALREQLVRALGDGIATKLDLAEQSRILERHTTVLERLVGAVEEQGKRIEEQGKRIEEAFRRVEALGARWGLHSEEAFREGMRSVLERRFGARVRHWEGFDQEGVVFGHPASIELDVVVSNGGTLVIEVKSHVSTADLAAFERKTKIYEQQTGGHADRLVVSPSVEPRALQMAQDLGIQVSTSLA